MSVLYSNLTVGEFNSRLEVEMKEDVKNLFQNQQETTKIENLISHEPHIFLKERPLILVYSILKPMGLFENFCELSGKKLTKIQSYSICKMIEIRYKILGLLELFKNCLISFLYIKQAT